MAFNKKTRIFLAVILVAGWSLALGYQALKSGCLNRFFNYGRIYRDNRVLMGTFWEVTSPEKRAGEIVFSEASRIEKLLSKYNASSEVSRLNRTGKIKASPDTFYVIKRAQELSLRTSGAFDITVAPLVDLWGFTDRKFRVPGNTEIESAMKITGSDKIVLHEKDNMIEFKIPGMEIDLGGIGKGFALDCAVKKLKENGIADCLINAGGQVYALGNKFGAPWKVAVQTSAKPEISGTLELTDESASTSGDYEQFFLKDGKSYSHIIDPRTGYPAAGGITSVTVTADSALEADALSTAVFILGENGLPGLKAGFPKSRFYIRQGRAKEKQPEQ